MGVAPRRFNSRFLDHFSHHNIHQILTSVGNEARINEGNAKWEKEMPKEKKVCCMEDLAQ